MIFLNPAILFGLIAASIPVILHLLNLRKLKKIEFSSLQFLKELQKNKIRKIKLKQWLLLLLRTLIILFLVLSFARPALKGVSIEGVTSAAKTSAVIIIDDSFSMSVINQKGSYINQAKWLAKNIISNLQEGDESAIISTTSEMPEPVFTSALDNVQKEIDEITISDKRGSITKSLLSALTILEKSDNFNKEIYIISDYQSTGIVSDSSEVTSLSSLSDENTRLYILRIDENIVDNLSLSGIKSGNQIFEIGKNISFTATVKNNSEKRIENAVASLFVNNKRSAQQSFFIESESSTEIKFETILSDSELVKIHVELEDDPILNDNKNYMNIFVNNEFHILLLANAPDDMLFTELALLTNNNFIVERMNSSAFGLISSKNYDLVILTPSADREQWNVIKSYLQNYGSLLIFPFADQNLNDYNLFASEFNLPNTEGIINFNENEFAEFSNINFEHPVFIDLFEKKEKPSINSPEIYKYLKFSAGSKGNSIITLVDNSSFLSEYSYGNGKIFLFNTAPVLSWTNFPLKSIFVPIISKSVYYLSSESNTEKPYWTGSSVPINISKADIFPLSVRINGNEKYFIPNDSLVNSNYVYFSKTDQAGNYEIYSGSELISSFSINTDPKESITDYINKNDFTNYLDSLDYRGNVFPLDINEDILASIYQTRFGTELWRFFLIIALLLALAEMFISKSSKKDLANYS